MVFSLIKDIIKFVSMIISNLPKTMLLSVLIVRTQLYKVGRRTSGNDMIRTLTIYTNWICGMLSCKFLFQCFEGKKNSICRKIDLTFILSLGLSLSCATRLVSLMTALDTSMCIFRKWKYLPPSIYLWSSKHFY